MDEWIAKAGRRLPGWAKRVVRGLFVPGRVWRIERGLGDHVLREAAKFSRSRRGDPEALRARRLLNCLHDPGLLEALSESHQHLQTAFMADYERHLYEYYREQQYLLLLAFLGYPYRGRGCLASYTQPYLEACARLPRLRLLDYGAGLPYGLIHVLREHPEKIEAVTLVDLDLVHTELVESILADHRHQVEVTYLKLKDAQAVPALEGRSYNFVYGKDIFEHLSEPERHLKAILARTEHACLAYLDLSDHGTRYLQHVHPRLAHLRELPGEYSFAAEGRAWGLSKFAKGL